MTKGQMQNLEHEYYSIYAANPALKMTLWEFFIDKGCSPDDIWSYSPQIGYQAEQLEPEWM